MQANVHAALQAGGRHAHKSATTPKCDEIRLHSGDYIDIKMYEPAMRHFRTAKFSK